jgi:phenylpyruvate tautomerase PptA (4-oxalocrotonate tautomerase family)
MPIIAVESSVRLPVEQRSAALRTLVASANELLAIVPPTQLRLRIVDVPVDSMAVGEVTASNDEPWIVVFAHVLEGRADAQIAHFMTAFAETVAGVFGVDAGTVRVLVQPYPKAYWQIGRRSAAAVGR